MASTKDTVNNEQADVYRPTLPTSLNSEATLSVPSVIPPEHDHRTLVLCFDGTGDQFDADNSNIVQLVSLLKKNDRNKQMVYYQVSSHQPEYSSSHSSQPVWHRHLHLFQGCGALVVSFPEGV